MNRRRVVAALTAAASSSLWLPMAVSAQPTPDEGIDYRLLRDPVPTSSPGKIEVLEFFWYACPHCFQLEPFVNKWKKSLGSDVVFKKVHVAFRGDTQQKIFYTLDALGEEERLGAKVFEEIHQRGGAMATLTEALEWARRQALDVAKFEATWNSFGVQTQQKRANALVAGYRIESVPTFAVNGRYITSPAMAGGSHARALQIVDHLMAKERQSKRK